MKKGTKVISKNEIKEKIKNGFAPDIKKFMRASEVTDFLLDIKVSANQFWGFVKNGEIIHKVENGRRCFELNY